MMRILLPADKSISQRAALFAALADGTSVLRGYPTAADPQSMLACIRQLGILVEENEDEIRIHGKGLKGLQAPASPLDCGNSGTAMRFLAGVLAGQPFDSTLIGDASLSKRPMGRIANPLAEMGAQIQLTEGHAPIHIQGNPDLKGMCYTLPVASAQVKSCVLLAGFFGQGETTVIEKVPTRNHTELMLGLNGVEKDGKTYITVKGGQAIAPFNLTIPRDFSAAAFFLVAGSIRPNTVLELPNVGLNPSRTALLQVLQDMGANIEIKNQRIESGEVIGDLWVKTAALKGIEIGGEVIANLIDEIPILAIAATQATGRTVIKDAEELRVKETDRIEAMVNNLKAIGANIEALPDGMVIEGGAPLHGATVASFHDHRIAMSMGVAQLVCPEVIHIQDAEAASVSFPTFWEVLAPLLPRF